jgi:hypothetical protein
VYDDSLLFVEIRPYGVEEARYRADAQATRRARRRLLESRRRSIP